MDVEWDGLTRPDYLSEEMARLRNMLADCAKAYDWAGTLKILVGNPKLVNSTRPGGSSLYAPLHQVAHGPASVDVIKQMLELGAWRTLRTSRGERPVDIAVRKGHAAVVPILEPAYKRQVAPETLRLIQKHFHKVIRVRAGHLVDKFELRLPELEPLLELSELRMAFPVPGMTGGFYYHLEGEGVGAKLIVDSWSRVVEGSEQRHEITSSGAVDVTDYNKTSGLIVKLPAKSGPKTRKRQ